MIAFRQLILYQNKRFFDQGMTGTFIAANLSYTALAESVQGSHFFDPPNRHARPGPKPFGSART
jgi:hypothetical protein